MVQLQQQNYTMLHTNSCAQWMEIHSQLLMLLLKVNSHQLVTRLWDVVWSSSSTETHCDQSFYRNVTLFQGKPGFSNVSVTLKVKSRFSLLWRLDSLQMCFQHRVSWICWVHYSFITGCYSFKFVRLYSNILSWWCQILFWCLMTLWHSADLLRSLLRRFNLLTF